MENQLTVMPGGAVLGTVLVPGDKSITHRAYIVSALCIGESHIENALESEDCQATRRALESLGVQFIKQRTGHQTVLSDGREHFKMPGHAMDLGNAGTGIRLLSGVLAACPFRSTLSGDASLVKRPMARIIQPLTAMGARIDAAQQQYPPLVIEGRYPLNAITYSLPVASAQVKSAILLAGLYAKGVTEVIEPTPSRDHTERLLIALGYPIEKTVNGWRIEGLASLKGGHFRVPGDISSALFVIVATLLLPGSRCHIPTVGLNPLRLGGIRILQAMGGKIEITNQRMACGEPVGDVVASYSPLKGIDIPQAWVPSAIDEFPIICIAAACAKGLTTFHGAAELRVKESDRISVMATALKTLGISVKEFSDGLSIQGGTIMTGEVDAQNDHRVAMSLIIAGMGSQQGVKIRQCGGIATSFPGFITLMQAYGLTLKEENFCE